MRSKPYINDCPDPQPKEITDTVEKAIQGFDLWRWPEFEAFARRLGIDLEAEVTELIIAIPAADLVTVTERKFAKEPRK